MKSGLLMTKTYIRIYSVLRYHQELISNHVKHNHVRLWDVCKSEISFRFCFQEELPKTQEQMAYAKTKIFLMKENGKSHRVGR